MEEYRKIHFIFVLNKIFSFIRVTLFPFLIFVFITHKGQSEVKYLFGYGIVTCILFILAYLKWKFTKYMVTNKSFTLHTGWLNKEIIVYPIETIQGIHFHSNIIYRLFHVVCLKIETAGVANQPSVEIILKEEEAKKIKNLIFPNEKDEQWEERFPYKKVNVKDLIIMSTTSTGVFIGLSFLLSLYFQLEELFPKFISRLMEENRFLNAGKMLLKGFNEKMTWMDFIWMLLFIFSILFICWLLGAISTILKYHDFKVTRKEDKLEVSYGLLVTRKLTLPVKRIQALIITEGLLRQPFGLAGLKVESIGYGEESSGEAILFPLLKKKEISLFLKEILPEFYVVESLKRSPKQGLPSYLIRGMFFPLIVLIGLIYLFDYGYLFALTLPFFVCLSVLRHKDAGLLFTENFLFIRKRFFSKETIIIPNKSIQSLDFKQHRFQKKKGLCHYEISIATDLQNKSFIVKDLSENEIVPLIKWTFESLSQPFFSKRVVFNSDKKDAE